jgi:hypothetical protein
MKTTALILAAAIALCACATTVAPPAPLEGRPDVQRFRVYTAIGVPEARADADAGQEIEAFRTRNGYRSFTVLERRWNHLPTFFEYLVRFDRAPQ